MKILFGFHILYLIWTLMFLIETSSFIIGGAATSWYFNHEEPYSEASQRYRKKHIGSVIKGAFLLALLGIIRIIYEALVPRGENEAESCIRRCCDCICCCCQQIFEWFTSGAFTLINIRGNSFCTSGMEAFKLRISNIGTSAVVSIVQTVFLS